MSNTILLTGGGGFIGKNVLARLLQNHFTVYSVTRTASYAPVQGNLHYIPVDLLTSVVPPVGSLDAIIHIAATSPRPDVTMSDYIRDNIVLTEKITQLSARINVKKIIYFSSISIHGEITDPVVDETTKVVNPEPYGLSKLVGEHIVRNCSPNISTIAIRLPGVIGRGSVRNWLTRMLEHAAAGEDIAIFNPNAAFNNAVYVDDLVDFTIGLLSHDWSGNETVCLGSADCMPIVGIADYIVAGTGGRSKVKVKNAIKSTFTIDIQHAQRQFNYRPMTMREMLERFIKENVAQ